MSKQPLQSESTQQLPLAQELDNIGLGQGIPRNEGETDADYAERMVYELDVEVERLWGIQDSIRELVSVDE